MGGVERLEPAIFNAVCGALLPRPYDEDNDARHEGETAENGRKWDRLGGVLGGVNRANIQDFISFCITNALVSEGEKTKYQQYNAKDSRGLHAN